MDTSSGFEPKITAEQIYSFREHGFLSIERITTDHEVERLRPICDELFAMRAGEDKGLFYDLAAPRGHRGRDLLPQVLGPDLTFPELRKTLYFQNARRIASALLGVDIGQLNLGGHMILKPKHYGSETPWHQDEAYWNPDEILNSLSVWMSLDEASVESGCMQFIPGSHKGDVKRHRHIDNNPLVHGLVTDDVDPSLALACPVPAGGATFHHSGTLHYTGPNKTENDRRAYILVCSGPSRKRAQSVDRPWQAEERLALARAGIEVEVF